MITASVYFLIFFGLLWGSTFEYTFDAELYDEKVRLFTEKEAIAIAYIDDHMSLTNEELVESIREVRKIWEENQQIAQEISRIVNLSAELVDVGNILYRYASMRVVFCDLLIHTVLEDTDKYETQIRNTAWEMEKLIEELEQRLKKKTHGGSR